MLPQTETSSEDASFNDSLSAGPPSQPLAPSGSFTLELSEAMAEKLLPPSLDCMVFGDNPREWKLFESEFEVNVKCHFKCEKKLISYLLKFTCNKAKATVSGCRYYLFCHKIEQGAFPVLFLDCFVTGGMFYSQATLHRAEYLILLARLHE